MFNTKPKIRTRTVTVPVKKPPAGADKPFSTSDAPRKPSQTQANSIANSIADGTNGSLGKASVAAAPTSRYSLTPSGRAQSVSAQSRPDRKSLSVSHVQQRKRKVTPSTPQWASSDSESSNDEDEDRLGVRKRQKTSSSMEPMGVNRSLEPDLNRRIRIQDPGLNGEPAKKKPGKEAKLIHGLQMSTGAWNKDFRPAFPGSEHNLVVRLQYPSPSPPEKFATAIPHDNSNFNPIDDIYFNIEEIIQHYLPSDLSAELSSDITGPVRLLKRAVTKGSPEDFQSALNDFNALIKAKLEDGTIPRVLDALHSIPLSLTKRILAQVYQRTVSPQAHLLRKVKGKETTYGELLPPFVHTIFHQTRLNSSSVFVDLGSGVGNVVLQSALQTGAESWGIEVLPTPASFANEQADELRARAKLWNISLGSIHLLQGDFRKPSDIDAILGRADVVLVNNKVFPQQLNGVLLDKFLDLKMGCKVVSLASFGGGGKQGLRNEQSIANLFDEEKFDSGTNSVSWAGESVEYFIATKAR
ncbi:DOT1-domain-containing protein [Lindgomyces ingoldianus]|uniref:DOT1-domain-containing protein n=1 Tax=Lindgomyces ingoldianus TaxID=673940 RepID=A0ACB6QPM5_9PLEO|nr:DOT1-domain-containing protein [Lindgomyces ingoldianus]KAF2468979.1 DOT1-domain-containing protein [Lindgomyces ingoldianus]